MTDRKQKIINVLDNFKDYIIGGDINDDIADAILALTLDVPTEDEVVEESLNGHISLFDRGWMSYFNDSERGIFIQGATWMKEEIIKRNK